MAITRTAIAREIPPQAARTAPRNEAHQLSRPKFRQNRYVPKKRCQKLSGFIALLSPASWPGIMVALAVLFDRREKAAGVW